MRQSESKARQSGRAKWLALAFVAVLEAEALAQNGKTAQQAMQQTTEPKAARQIVVSIPERKLAVVEDGRVRKVYRVAVGARKSPSPAGQFKVVTKLADPTWYTPGKVVGPGPGNPLGNRWMGLNKKGYGIHGTNAPNSIGRAASHGCIRMGKHDVEELFNMVQVGDTVEIHEERSAELAQLFDEQTENKAMAQAETAAGAGSQ